MWVEKFYIYIKEMRSYLHIIPTYISCIPYDEKFEMKKITNLDASFLKHHKQKEARTKQLSSGPI